MLIASVRHPVNCRCRACDGRWTPRITAAVIVTLAVSLWLLITLVVGAML